MVRSLYKVSGWLGDRKGKRACTDVCWISMVFALRPPKSLTYKEQNAMLKNLLKPRTPRLLDRGINNKKGKLFYIFPVSRYTNANEYLTSIELISFHPSKGVTTFSIYTGLHKSKHPQKRFQDFGQSRVLSTDGIKIPGGGGCYHT